MKKTLTISIIFLACFFALDKAHAATEFVSIVDTGGASDSDYSTLSSWENAIGTNLTAPDTFVFSGSVTGTAPADGAQVTLYRSGTPQGIGATVVHTAKAGTQIMLKGVGNTSPAYYQASDEWRIDASNLFLLSGTAPDQPQVTAKCRATTGAADTYTSNINIDGWDTDATHYIKIWTDPSENYRHQGKWDISKYRIEGAASSIYLIRNYENYTKFDGLQVKVIYGMTTSRAFLNSATSMPMSVSNSIVVGYANADVVGVGIDLGVGSGSLIWNNIVYGFKSTSNYGSGIGGFGSGYVYNNTVTNCGTGISSNYQSILAKNNIAYNNVDNYSVNFQWAGGCSNNLSGPSSDSDIAGQTAPQNGVTVTFADEYNNDFHLDSADTGAKNHGTILYDSGDDANLYFTTDTDNEARKDSAGTWDIGADENVAKIYRSVGPSASSALAAGGSSDSSYGNMEIKPTYLNVGSTANLTDYIATFWRPLPDNVGVGDALQYDQDNSGGIDNIVFITKRIDSTHYSVRKSDGTAPTLTTLPNSTWAVYRSYISLSNAEAGTENTGINDTVENFDTGNVNLTTNNLQWNFACFANGTAPDQTAVTISGWTTTADNYMRIYTPTRTDEVGTTQRHGGKWDTGKYYISVTNANVFNIQSDYVRLDGLQLTETSPTSAHVLLWTSNITAVSNNVRISNNIFKGHNSGTYGEYGMDINDPDTNARIWNNIIYDIPDLGGSNRGISLAGNAYYIYNNTIIGPNQGIRLTSGNAVVKNNIVQTTSSGYLLTGGTWDSTSTNNLSDHADAPGSNPQNSKTVSFVDTTNKDFHLGVGDTAARNIGADLSNDLYLPIQTDIDSSGSIDGKSCDAVYQDQCLTRPGLRQGSGVALWDIGADELITKIYRSVGVGTTAAIISGTSPAISLTISGNTGTFSTFPTSADFGVGDVIRYDSDNNGSLDSTAFISAIDSTAKTATLQSSTGASPTAMATPDFDWKLYRAYTRLYDWEEGTENTGIGVTFDAGNRDIVTNSEQWNVACYSPTGGTAPDTTGVYISGWTTAQQNYIKVYTPTLSSEATTSQRHQGKWDDGKYRLEAASVYSIYIVEGYIKIDGLQFKTAYLRAETSRNNRIDISNNIFNANRALLLIDSDNNTYIWNNIIYGIDARSSWIVEVKGTSYIYNNTIYNANRGIQSDTVNGVLAINNIISNVNYAAVGTFAAGSGHNATDEGTMDYTVTGGAIGDKVSQTFSFVDSTNKDFHLSSSDTAAKDAGADLSKDLYLPITSDIDSQTKPTRARLSGSESLALVPGIDIGADQSATAIYRSLAPGATSSIASGTSPANSMIIAGTSVTFGTAPGDTVGVGDAIQYDSDNNGSIDSIAFISERTSGTVYTIQDRTGGTPTSTSATDYDWSIFRAYTSLQNASGSTSGGTENTGLSDNIEHFDIDWAAAHGKNIYTYNQQWNIAAYANSTTADSTATTISGWTTYPTNYLKIYTPYATTEVGTSQRHQGKWDTSKYYLSTSGVIGVVGIYPKYFRIDGIQMLNSATSGWPVNTSIYVNSLDSDIQISNNIIRGSYSGITQAFGIATGSYGYVSNTKIWNNIIYGINGGTNDTSIQFSGGNIYAYNNTVYDTDRAYKSDNTAKFFVKNNIAQNCTDGYYGTFDSSSDYNISDVDASDAPNLTFTNDYANVTFADEANYDFHLGIGDTAARNAGADLSADSYLPITTDIDGHTRPTGTNVVDIGADEGATGIYYSVGQSTSTDFKVSSNVTVNGYTATFTTAQTGNIGVGDIVTYDGGSCYITGKTSTSIWSCQNATGGTAPQVSGVSVTSIKRAFASLNSSISGSTAPTFLNTSDLKTNNYILNIPCYMDSGTTPDTTAVTIQGYTTAVPNYIKVYTPNNTTTEANQSQRHQGKWDDGKYNLSVSNTDVLSNRVDYFRIDGLQISTPTVNSNGQHVIHFDDSLLNVSNQIEISNCILKGANSNSYYQSGIRGSNGGKEKVYAWNNIFYNFGPGDSNQYARVIYSRGSTYLYNSTIIGGYYGLYRSSGSFKAKNVYAGGSTNGDFTSVTLTTSASSDTTGTAGLQSIGVGLTTFTNVTSGQEDYHLASNSALKNVGTDLSSGTYPDYAFTTDIDDNTRNTDSRGWDIGADESATPIYYSVGQSSSDLKTGSPTLSIDSSGNGTLSVSQTGNMGVGDYIEYGTSPYNKAYITGKTSSTVWTVQSATGTMLGVATTEPVNSIKHSYTSLSGAIAGASGSTMMNTTDLYTNNLQLNVPCYMDSGTADTTAVTISGYTTYSTNYIKVYTPTNTSTEANNSQRHSGKWDDGKYRLETTNTSSLAIAQEYSHIDGLQVKLTETGSNRKAFYIQEDNTYIENNLVRGIISNSITMSPFGVYASSRNNSKVWNNIVYGFSGGSSGQYGIGIYLLNGSSFLYNNTVYNSAVGTQSSNAAILAKNNITQNCTDGYSGTFNSSSDYNISDLASDTTGGAHDKQATVNFVDKNNYDFHLAENDTAARNAGADLSADSNLAVTTDIDGNSRGTDAPPGRLYDIGADQAATYIYYSVGQNTNDHKTGSPNITLSGYNATLDVAQTAPNMGVGDLITYTGGSCYITAKTNDDKMHWNCQNATGGTAPQVSGVSVTSIAHAFDSLGGTNGALKSTTAGAKTTLGTTDLYTGNYILNIPCYYDTGADTSPVTTLNWTTATNNYIKVYTPNNTSTEVNQTQRHSGKWDDGKYSIIASRGGDGVIYNEAKFIKFEGLQIENTADASTNSTLGIRIVENLKGNISISSNIIRYTQAGTPGTSDMAIYLEAARGVINVWNNIIYNFGAAISNNYGNSGNTYFIYNNTLYGNAIGIVIQTVATSYAYAKNNIVQGATDGYYGSFATGSDYNISNVSSDTTGGAHDKQATVTFADAANDDFHLSQNDTAAFGAGTDLSADSYLPFSTDIDGETRTKWCIGADDFVENAYKSRGNLKTRGNVKMH